MGANAGGAMPPSMVRGDPRVGGPNGTGVGTAVAAGTLGSVGGTTEMAGTGVDGGYAGMVGARLGNAGGGDDGETRSGKKGDTKGKRRMQAAPWCDMTGRAWALI